MREYLTPMAAHYRYFSFGLLIASFIAPVSADTLLESFQLASEYDAEVRAAEARYHAGRQALPKARAALLPQIGLEGTHTHTDIKEGSSLPFFSGEGSSKGYEATLSQKVVDVNAWYTYRSGIATSKQAASQYESAQDDLIVRVAEAYFDVLRAQVALKTAQSEEKSISRQLEQSKKRFDVGLIAITGVHESQARYDSTVANRLAAEGQVGIAKEALLAITGQTPGTLADLNDDYPIIAPDPLTSEEWVNLALASSSDLQAVGHGKDAAKANSSAKRAAHFPTISAVAQRKYDSENFIESADYFVAKIEVPISTGGFAHAERREARYKLMEAEEQLADAERDIIQATRSLHLSVVTDVARVRASKQAVTSSQSALDATQAGYDVGTRNIVDVLNAQRELFRAQRDYANTRYDYVVNMLKLKEVAGTLSSNDIANIHEHMSNDLNEG